MKKMRGLLVSLLTLSLSLAGCGGDDPTPQPTQEPTQEPTAQPTVEPTQVPTAEPTTEPTAEPTVEPTEEPQPGDIVIKRVEFAGLDDIEVNVGDAINPKTGVSVKVYYEDNGAELSFIVTSYVTITQDGELINTACNTQNEGTYTLTYTVDPSKIIGFDFSTSDLLLTATRTLKVNKAEVSGEELIKNGDFSAGAEHWATFTDGSDVSFNYDQGYMECIQNSISGNSYSPRLNTTYPNTGDEFTLQYGVTYLFSIDLWASANKTIQVQLGTLFPSDPYWGSLYDQNGEQLIKQFNVTTEKMTYTWEFTLSSNTSTNTHMTLEMGTVNGDATVANVYADNISLKAAVDDGVDRLAPSISGNTNLRVSHKADSSDVVDVLAGIVVADNADEKPELTYEIKDAEGNLVEEIKVNTEGEYTVTYTAVDAAGNKAVATRVIKVVSGQQIGTDYANPSELVWGANGEGGEAEIANKGAWDTWHYWYVPTPDWNCGPVVNANATMENGVLTIAASGLDANPNNWSSQLFWKSEEVAAGKYKVSLIINSDVERAITLNGATYNLVVGDNQISLDAVLTESGHVGLAFLLGDGGQLAEGVDASNLTFRDLNVVYTGTDLANPSELVWGANGEGGQDAIAANGAWDTWHYWYVPTPDWNCGPVVNANAIMENGVLTIEASALDANPNNWSSQLFWKSDETDAGTYAVSVKIHSDRARKITLNGASYDLVEGDNVIKTNVTLGEAGHVGLAFLLGDGGQLAEGDDVSVLKFSELDVYPLGKDLVEPTGLVWGANGEGGQDAIAANGAYNIWHYWYVPTPDWNCGPTIGAEVSFENGVLTISNTGLAANPNPWSSQLFYGTDETAAGTYELVMNVNSSVARSIEIAGQVIELQAGDNVVKAEINHAADGRITLVMLLGGANLTSEDASTLVIGDVTLLPKA